MFKNIIFIISLAFFAFTNFAVAETQTGAPNIQDQVSTNAASVSEVPDSAEGSESDEMANEEEEVEKTLKVSDAWARVPISSNNNSAAYMSINNPTDQQITILGASAAVVANNVELHKSFVDEKGISRMTSIDKIVVPAKSSINLAPGDIHIMLFDLKRRLNAGDSFKIILAIEDMDPITVDTEVK